MQGLFPCGRRVRLPPSGGSRMRILRLALLLALAFPAAAQAEDATIVMRTVPLAGERALASREATRPLQPRRAPLARAGLGAVPDALARRSLERLGGCSSRGRGPARQRHRASAARSGSWRLGNPWWVGPSDRIEYRLRGQRHQAPRRSSSGARLRASPGARSRRPARPRSSRAAAGTRTRRSGARRRRIAPALRLALVHHTAGANGYTAAQSPAIVRAIQLYHVKGNGWNDIGYNFLVDRFGQVFEGRYGGIERNVVGAHAEGFNTGSVGVSLLGEYSSLAVSQKARDAIAALLAWRLDVAHVDPASTLSFISGGNARFPAGLPVFLRTVSGHRDAGFTDCPGNQLYGLLTRARGRGVAARPAEAVLAARHRHRAGHGSIQGATVVGAALDGRGLRLVEDRRRLVGRASGPTWTGRGTQRWSRPAATRTRSGRRTA